MRAFKHGLIFSRNDLQELKDSGWSALDFKKEALKWSTGTSIASQVKFLQLMLWMSDWTFVSPFRNRDPTMREYLRTLEREYYG